MDDLTEVKEDVATIKETLKWHKWLLVGVLASSALPKVGGPDPTAIAAAFAAHLLG